MTMTGDEPVRLRRRLPQVPASMSELLTGGFRRLRENSGEHGWDAGQNAV